MFHYEKKDTIDYYKIIQLWISLKNILLENYYEFANRFLNKGVGVETGLPC